MYITRLDWLVDETNYMYPPTCIHVANLWCQIHPIGVIFRDDLRSETKQHYMYFVTFGQTISGLTQWSLYFKTTHAARKMFYIEGGHKMEQYFMLKIYGK